MSGIEIKAYAKLNLSLDVLGILPGGYHEVKTVMQTASLCDEIRIDLNKSGEVSVRTNFSFLPKDERNIAAKAARAFFAAAEMNGYGAELTLKKRIPVGAGLGGGSADAAAVLRGLNDLTGVGFSQSQLEELGGTLGSDVPFCICGGTRLGMGTGDQLSPAPIIPACCFVICKPRFSVRTPDLFAKIDSRRSRIHPDTEGLLATMRDGDLAGMARRMYNVFEDVLPRRCSEIGTIKNEMLDAGALGAVMTGTGSAVFGVFTDQESARTAAEVLGRNYRECFVASPIEKY